MDLVKFAIAVISCHVGQQVSITSFKDNKTASNSLMPSILPKLPPGPPQPHVIIVSKKHLTLSIVDINSVM